MANTLQDLVNELVANDGLLLTMCSTEVSISQIDGKLVLTFYDTDTKKKNVITDNSVEIYNLLAAWLITDTPNKPFNLSVYRKKLKELLH